MFSTTIKIVVALTTICVMNVASAGFAAGYVVDSSSNRQYAPNEVVVVDPSSYSHDVIFCEVAQYHRCKAETSNEVGDISVYLNMQANVATKLYTKQQRFTFLRPIAA